MRGSERVHDRWAATSRSLGLAILAWAAATLGQPCANLTSTFSAVLAGNTSGTSSEAASCGGADAPESSTEFTAPRGGLYVFDTEGSAFDTVLYVLNEQGTEVACSDDVEVGVNNASRVAIPLAAGQRVRVVVDGFGSESGAFRLRINPSCSLPFRADPRDLGSAPLVSVSGDITCAFDQVPPASCGDGTAGPDASFVYTAPVAGLYEFSTEGSSFDTVLSLRLGTCTGAELACSDDVGPELAQSRLSVALAPGQTVVATIEGKGEAAGLFLLSVAASPFTPTVTATRTASRSPSATHTPTPTRTRTATPTVTVTRTATVTATITRTPAPTSTPSFSATATATRTPLPSRSPTQTRSPTPSATPSRSRTPAITFTASLAPTPSPSATDSPRPPSPSASPPPSPTVTPTLPDETHTPSPSPQASPTPALTFTATSTPSASPTPRFTLALPPTPTEPAETALEFEVAPRQAFPGSLLAVSGEARGPTSTIRVFWRQGVELRLASVARVFADRTWRLVFSVPSQAVPGAAAVCASEPVAGRELPFLTCKPVQVLSFPAAATLSGTSRLADGAPAVGVEVELADQQGAVVARTVSDANGSFHFIAVEPGPYRLRARCRHTACATAYFPPRDVFLGPGSLRNMDVQEAALPPSAVWIEEAGLLALPGGLFDGEVAWPLLPSGSRLFLPGIPGLGFPPLVLRAWATLATSPAEQATLQLQVRLLQSGTLSGIQQIGPAQRIVADEDGFDMPGFFADWNGAELRGGTAAVDLLPLVAPRATSPVVLSWEVVPLGERWGRLHNAGDGVVAAEPRPEGGISFTAHGSLDRQLDWQVPVEIDGQAQALWQGHASVALQERLESDGSWRGRAEAALSVSLGPTVVEETRAIGSRGPDLPRSRYSTSWQTHDAACLPGLRASTSDALAFPSCATCNARTIDAAGALRFCAPFSVAAQLDWGEDLRPRAEVALPFTVHPALAFADPVDGCWLETWAEPQLRGAPQVVVDSNSVQTSGCLVSAVRRFYLVRCLGQVFDHRTVEPPGTADLGFCGGEGFAPRTPETSSAWPSPALALRPDGEDVWALWVRDSSDPQGSSELVWGRATPRGLEEVAVLRRAAAIGSPRLGFLANDSALAVWEEARSGIREPSPAPALMYAVWQEGTWSGAAELQGNEATNRAPVLAVGGGTAWLLWLSQSSDGNSVWSARFAPGEGWAPPVLVRELGAATVRGHTVAVEAGGNALAVWSEQVPGQLPRLWHARFFDGAWSEVAPLGEEPAVAPSARRTGAGWSVAAVERSEVWGNTSRIVVLEEREGRWQRGLLPGSEGGTEPVWAGSIGEASLLVFRGELESGSAASRQSLFVARRDEHGEWSVAPLSEDANGHLAAAAVTSSRGLVVADVHRLEVSVPPTVGYHWRGRAADVAVTIVAAREAGRAENGRSQVELQVRVKNLGLSSTARPFSLRIFEGEEGLSAGEIPALRFGEERALEERVERSTGSVGWLVVVADREAVLDEEERSNNTARIRVGVPPAPNGVAAGWDASEPSAHLSWGAVPEASSYRVYRAEEAEPWELLEATVSPWLRDHTVEIDRQYQYRVTAVGVGGVESAPSSVVTVRIQPVIPPCAGDCDGNREVTIDEILRGVNIALGLQEPAVCAAMDAGGDGQVTVDELIAAVQSALRGCALGAPLPMR